MEPKHVKKLFTGLLAVMLCIGIADARIFAEEEETQSDLISEEIETEEEEPADLETGLTDEISPYDFINLPETENGRLEAQLEEYPNNVMIIRLRACADDGYYCDELEAVNSYGYDAVIERSENEICFYPEQVTVSAHFKSYLHDGNYYLITDETEGIDVSFSVMGKEAESAATGDIVTVNAEAAEGYSILKKCVRDSKGNPVRFLDEEAGTFEMPASDIRVETVVLKQAESCELTSMEETDISGKAAYALRFATDPQYTVLKASAMDAEGNEHVVMLLENMIMITDVGHSLVITLEIGGKRLHTLRIDMKQFADAELYVNGEKPASLRSIRAFEPVEIRITPVSGFTLTQVSVTDKAGNPVDYQLSQDNILTFEMPDSDADVNAEFQIQDGMTYYMDENGTAYGLQIPTSLNNVTDQPGVTLCDGWYISQGTRVFNERVTIVGEVNLILSDDSDLTFNSGIQNNSCGHLIIWGQKKGSGQLHSGFAFDSTEGNAAIGGNKGWGAGILDIHGGFIEATGQEDAAGIGGGEDGCGGRTTIYGGSVRAFSLCNGAGIGGGDDADGGTITINGGTVYSMGGTDGWFNSGAGIGGGNNADGGVITINGGNITAIGGASSAGIGGGDGGSGGTILITGGEIYAKGGCRTYCSGAGIGGGDEASGGNITITGGRIKAFGGAYDNQQEAAGAGIGGGDCGDSGDIVILGGEIFAESYRVNHEPGDLIFGAGIGGGDDGSANNIQILGGIVEGIGYRAVGCGEDGSDGNIILGDNIEIEGIDWNDRYSYLTWGHLVFRAR